MRSHKCWRGDIGWVWDESDFLFTDLFKGQAIARNEVRLDDHTVGFLELEFSAQTQCAVEDFCLHLHLGLHVHTCSDFLSQGFQFLVFPGFVACRDELFIEIDVQVVAIIKRRVATDLPDIKRPHISQSDVISLSNGVMP